MQLYLKTHYYKRASMFDMQRKKDWECNFKRKIYSQSTFYQFSGKRKVHFITICQTHWPQNGLQKDFWNMIKHPQRREWKEDYAFKLHFRVQKASGKHISKKKLIQRKKVPDFLRSHNMNICVCFQNAGRRFSSRNLCHTFWSSFERAAKSSPQSAWRAQRRAFQFKSSGTPLQDKQLWILL